MFEKILKYVEEKNYPHLGKIDISILKKEEELSSKTRDVHFTYEKGSVISEEIINKKL